MTLTRMFSNTRRNFFMGILTIMAMAIFVSNVFAAPITKPVIPATTSTSVLRAQVSCGYYPTADGRTVNSYFTVAYNGLGFTDMGYDNGTLLFYFAKKPASVISFNGRPFNGDVGNLVNAQAGKFITVSAYAMGYEINSLLITFDDSNVPGGKVYFKVTMDLRTKQLFVNSLDVNRNYLGSVASQTWSGPTPRGQVDGVLRQLSTVKVFGSQGLYFAPQQLNIDRTLRLRNVDAGANFLQNGQTIVGKNNGSKSTQKLTYILTDNTGCEGMSYIEIK